MDIIEFSLNFFMHDYYRFVFLLLFIGLVWPTRLIYLPRKDVLCNGFDLMVLNPSDGR